MFTALLFTLLTHSMEGELPLTHAEAKARAAQVQVTNYTVHLNLNEKGFDGKVIIDLQLKNAATPLFLDFRGEAVTELVLDGKTVPDFQVNQGRITIPTSHLSAGARRIQLTFKGQPGRDGNGLLRYVDEEDKQTYFFTDLQPFFAHYVYPCFDQPDLKAPIRLSVNAPETWTVVANAPGKRDQHGVWRFASTPPVSPYLFHLSAGPLHVIRKPGSKPAMALYCRRSQKDNLDASGIFEVTRQGLAYFESWLGEPYPYTKYDHVYNPAIYHRGMESPGAVMLHEFYLGKDLSPERKARRNAVILHEMAHMWIGNKITPTWWDDVWINEGLVNYLGDLAEHHLGVDPDGWFTGIRVEAGRRADQLEGGHPLMAEAHSTEHATILFNSLVYGKGLAVFRQLAALLGEREFQQAVRTLLKDHAWGTLDRTHFMNAMEKAGGQSLKTWQREWAASRGINQVEVVWTAENGRITGAAMHQEADPYDKMIRMHKLQVGLFYEDDYGKVVMTDQLPVQLKGAGARLETLVGRPEPLLLLIDPHGKAFVRTTIDQRSLSHLDVVFPKLASLQVRTRIWRILVDMVRDRGLTTQQFMALGLQFASGEPDLRLLDDILDDLVVLVSERTDKKRPAHIQKLFHHASQQLGQAKDKGVRRKWFEVLLAVAETEKQLDEVYRLYTGRQTKANLTFSKDDRWRFCLRLVAGNHLMGEMMKGDLIDEDRACPDGQHYQRIIAVVTPTLAAKQEAWQLLTSGDLSLGDLMSLGRHFHDPRRPELTQDFVTPFFTALAQIYHRYGAGRASAFNAVLFPKYGGQKTRAAAAAFLKQHREQALQYMVRRKLGLMDRRESLID